MSRLTETTIGEILDKHGGEVKTGPFGTTLKASEYSSSGVPVISVGEIGYGEFRIHERTPFVETDVTDRLPEYLLELNDIIFARKGGIDRSAIVGEDQVGWFLGSDGIRLRMPPAVSPRYVRYWVGSPTVRDWLFQNSTGSTMASLNQATVRRIPINLPLLSEQHEIAAILGALDDKIEVNRKASATLEAMARALYRSWFVDFDPVWAKLEGRPPALMPPATAALFPDIFDDNGLPLGWQMSSIYDLARVQYGAPFKSNLFNSNKDGRPLIRIRDLKNHKAGVYTTEVHKKEYLIQGGDTVVGMDGDFTPYTWCAEPSLMNQRVCAFLPHEQIDKGFVRYAIPALLKHEENTAVATTVIHLGKKDIDTFEVINPCDAVKNAFGDRVNPMLDKTVLIGLENQTLAALRDSLLPKLMSGEIRVGDARAQVEEVA